MLHIRQTTRLANTDEDEPSKNQYIRPQAQFNEMVKTSMMLVDDGYHRKCVAIWKYDNHIGHIVEARGDKKRTTLWMFMQ